MVNRVVEVWGARGAFVIRAEPEGEPMSPAWSFRDVPLRIRGALRLVLGHRRWVVSIRHRVDDPWGPAVTQETFATKAEAWRRADQLHDLYSGERPKCREARASAEPQPLRMLEGADTALKAPLYGKVGITLT